MADFEVKQYSITVEDHPSADKLEVAKLDDTELQSVVPKGEYTTGDVAYFIPENAIVPEYILKELGMWDEEKQRGFLAGKEGNRVKPAKLRNIRSDGILYRSDKPVTDLGIEKWEPEVPAVMNGKVFAKPDIPPYSEIENLKKYPNAFQIGEDVVISEKVHGTCAVYYYEYGTLYVSSKGQAKKGLALEDDGNIYWRVANEYNLKDRLQSLGFPKIALFGEILGVQDLKYGADSKNLTFRAFDFMLFDSMHRPDMKDFYVGHVKFLEFTNFVGIPRVPILYRGDWHPNYLKGMVDGKESVTGNAQHIKEGVVIKPISDRYDKNGRVIYKVISDEYLGRKNGTDYN